VDESIVYYILLSHKKISRRKVVSWQSVNLQQNYCRPIIRDAIYDCVYRIVEVKAYSHQGLPLTYELTTDTGLQSMEFAIDPSTGVVDLLRPLDYEQDPHQYHLKVTLFDLE